MPVMNAYNFSKLMKYINISPSLIAERLYISNSLISRWRHGSRTLNSSSASFNKLVDLFLEINQDNGLNELEAFFQLNAEENIEQMETELRLKLRKFLLSPNGNNTVLDYADNTVPFKIYSGVNERLRILQSFFETALSMDSKPDLYIREINNANWNTTSMPWHEIFQNLGYQYMESGGHIYYFSNLHIIKKEDFFIGWKFSAHKNLHPTYISNDFSTNIDWGFYHLEGTMTVTFPIPEPDPKQYYTAVYRDDITLAAHYAFLQNKYEQGDLQISLNTLDRLSYSMEYIKLNAGNLSPLCFAGLAPCFFFHKRKH